jgi:endonuclease YncB( thermonuclease family)
MAISRARLKPDGPPGTVALTIATITDRTGSASLHYLPDYVWLQPAGSLPAGCFVSTVQTRTLLEHRSFRTAARMLTIVLLAITAIPAGRPFNCTPARVWDGDGPVWCHEGPRLRLAGIAAREHDGTCRANQPCPKASAEVARDTLVRLLGTRNGRSRQGHILVRGPTLRCVSNGSAGRGRTGAWCVSPTNGDISCAMVASGTVLRWQRYWRGIVVETLRATGAR